MKTRQKVKIIFLIILFIIKIVNSERYEFENSGCQIACTRIFQPVCGCDGQTCMDFPNQCEIGSFNCNNQASKWNRNFCKSRFEFGEKCENENFLFQVLKKYVMGLVSA